MHMDENSAFKFRRARPTAVWPQSCPTSREETACLNMNQRFSFRLMAVKSCSLLDCPHFFKDFGSCVAGATSAEEQKHLSFEGLAAPRPETIEQRRESLIGRSTSGTTEGGNMENVGQAKYQSQLWSTHATTLVAF